MTHKERLICLWLIANAREGVSVDPNQLAKALIDGVVKPDTLTPWEPWVPGVFLPAPPRVLHWVDALRLGVREDRDGEEDQTGRET